MYRVITYRSRPLKKSTYPLDAADSAAPFGEDKNTEKKKPKKETKEKKKKKEKPEEKTYIIDGVEVREEDLTQDERADIESNSVLNQDGFYDPLPPLDVYDTVEKEKKGTNKLKIIGVVAVMVVVLAGIAVAMMFLF